MTDYDNTNRGAIWKNDKRETEKHPEWTGSINVDGKDYWLSAWRGDSSNPKAPVMSFSVKAKDAAHKQGMAQAKAAAQAPADFNDFDDSSIPF